MTYTAKKVNDLYFLNNTMVYSFTATVWAIYCEELEAYVSLVGCESVMTFRTKKVAELAISGGLSDPSFIFGYDTVEEANAAAL